MALGYISDLLRVAFSLSIHTLRALGIFFVYDLTFSTLGRLLLKYITNELNAESYYFFRIFTGLHLLYMFLIVKCSRALLVKTIITVA